MGTVFQFQRTSTIFDSINTTSSAREIFVASLTCRERLTCDQEVSGLTRGWVTTLSELFIPCASVTQQYNLVPARRRWRYKIGTVTVVLALCWLHVSYRLQWKGSRPIKERLYFTCTTQWRMHLTNLLVPDKSAGTFGGEATIRCTSCNSQCAAV